MKVTAASALMASFASAALESCLYCRYTDLGATFLESFSYCTTNPECLADQWNYIDRDCAGGWVRGNTMSLEYCEAEMAQCPTFVASAQYDLNEELGRHKNQTWTLPQGAMCEVEIDATQYVGRVLFDDVQGSLGIEGRDPSIPTDTKISFEGEVGTVLIYNAAESGSLRFTISFSGASTLMGVSGAILAMTAATMF